MWFCRPIFVKQDTAAVSDDKAQALCNHVQGEVTKLYNNLKPASEMREITFGP